MWRASPFPDQAESRPGLEHDLLVGDVVAEAKVAKGEPPLAFALRDGLQLLDVGAPGEVVRVGFVDER